MTSPLSSILLHEEPGIQVIGADLEVSQPVDWSHLVRPSMAHLVLNLDGDAVVLGLRIRLGIVPGTASLLRPDSGELVHASRLPGGKRHRFAVISIAPAWLTAQFGPALSALHPVLQSDDGCTVNKLVNFAP